jgi:hypothetical protein
MLIVLGSLRRFSFSAVQISPVESFAAAGAWKSRPTGAPTRMSFFQYGAFGKLASKMKASTSISSRLPSTRGGLRVSISMPMRAIELRSVNFSVASCVFRNSNSTGWRGQKPSVNVTARSSLFFTVRIWPSWLVQNSSGFIVRRGGHGALPGPTQAGRSRLLWPGADGRGGHFYGTKPTPSLL